MLTEDLPTSPKEWTDPERKLREGALAETETDLGGGDPRQGESWGPDRTVRASAVRRLLTDPELAPKIIRLRLKGARIEGKLDFEAATLHGTLELTGCHISEVVNLEQATAPAIYLKDCYLAGLTASQLHTVNNLFLTGSTCDFAELLGAQIEGQLSLVGATFPGEDARIPTLALDGISVGADAFFDGMTVTGSTHLIGAKIDGQLRFGGATMNCRGGFALRAMELQSPEDVFFGEGFSADGAVELTGANIGGFLQFGQATFRNPGQTPALDLSRIHIKQDLTFADSFEAEGLVRLAGATINGQLDAKGAQFVHPSDTAIDARGLHVRDIDFSTASSHQEADRNRFRAEGKVILADATIDGTLNCSGASIVQPRSNEAALDAPGMTITRDLLLGQRFTADGMVVLTAADIGGKADLSGGSFKNAGQVALAGNQLTVRTELLLEDHFYAEGQVDLFCSNVGLLVIGGQIHRAGQDALVLDRLKAKQNVEFTDGFVVEGRVCMRGAEIGGHLTIVRPNLSRGRDGVALDLKGTTVTGTLRLQADNPVGGQVDLRQAKVRTLEDEEKFWPKEDTLLAGFTYDSLWEIESRPVEYRLDWLKVNGMYSAQPYEQLASLYQASGYAKRARKVLYTGQKRRPSPSPISKIWSWVLRLTVGYGYYPARVLWTLGLFEIFGWVFFSILRDEMKPSAALLGASEGNPREASKQLQPALYTLDLLLPLVSFGQRALWLPQHVTSWVATFLMVVGWVLGAILVYGISTAYWMRST